jgi:hypothetical protein
MAESHEDHRIIALQRAGRGADLWPAVEAAQYGYILQVGDGDPNAAAAPDFAFATDFRDIVEAWDTASPQDQAVLIGRLDSGVVALRADGRAVHWGLVHHPVATSGTVVEIPVAIIGFSGTDEKEMTVALHLDPLAVEEEFPPD